MLRTKKKYINVEEYFLQEELSEYKSEYFYGEVFAMAGGTPDHNRITINLATLLNRQFRGRFCEAFASDLRVQAKKNSHYTYPDIAVTCGELKFAEGRTDTITNPVVIIEVLSDSTKDYDRGTKFTAYRGIETLKDYILVEQDSVHIEYFSKEDDGTWRLREYFNLEEIFNIKSIQAALHLKEIYERVSLMSQ